MTKNGYIKIKKAVKNLSKLGYKLINDVSDIREDSFIFNYDITDDFYFCLDDGFDQVRVCIDYNNDRKFFDITAYSLPLPEDGEYSQAPWLPYEHLNMFVTLMRILTEEVENMEK